MGLFEAFEKLISEHGSAAILREHLALVKAEYAAMERKRADLQAQCDQLRVDNAQLQKDLRVLTGQLEVAGTKYVCDHCGSHRLKRTGNRPDPTFGAVGIKQAVFSCLECGKESAFTLDV